MWSNTNVSEHNSEKKDTTNLTPQRNHRTGNTQRNAQTIEETYGTTKLEEMKIQILYVVGRWEKM